MSEAKLVPVVEWLGPSFGCIDARLAAFRLEEGWSNILCMVRFSYQDCESVRELHGLLEERFEQRETEGFRVFLEAIPTAKVGSVFSSLQQGRLQLENEQILLANPVDPDEIELHSPHVLRGGPDEWRQMEGTAGVVSLEPTAANSLLADANKLGFPNVYELSAAWLETDFPPGMNAGVIFCVPIYARVSDIKYEPNRLTVRVREHEAIDDLVLHVVVSKKHAGGGAIRKRSDGVSWTADALSEPRPKGDFTMTVKIPGALATDDMQIRLVSETTGLEVDRVEGQLVRFQQERRISEAPLQTTFSRFYDTDYFGKCLLDPFQIPGDKADTFSRMVGRLFTLYGYCTLRIGETKYEKRFEKLYEPRTKASHNSVDILAWMKGSKEVLLVECTTGIPNSKGFDQLKEVLRILREEFARDDHIEFRAVLVTPRGCPTTKTQFAHDRDVLLLDRSALERLLDGISHRDFKRFDRFLLGLAP